MGFLKAIEQVNKHGEAYVFCRVLFMSGFQGKSRFYEIAALSATEKSASDGAEKIL